MSPPPRQSGRFDASSARSSSPRLAAQFNLEHDPLQSDTPQEESRGTSFLRELASGSFASGRFSAGVLLIIVLGVMAVCFWKASSTVLDDPQNWQRRDPIERAAEAPVVSEIPAARSAERDPDAEPTEEE
ncbi:MAG: hypothetical protein SFV23_24950 [Planctomycetaceae bacterium]|nr:hypothetical protein [Planctomycetaceae bacterium]